MIKVGIIGNIGSGKSYVAKQFRCPIFNADLEVKTGELLDLEPYILFMVA